MVADPNPNFFVGTFLGVGGRTDVLTDEHMDKEIIYNYQIVLEC